MSNKYSLVLWWWAARGFAHIGVIKHLEEQNTEIDEVIWTSMGSLIAACVAFWYTTQDMKKITEDTNFLKFLDFSMWGGILKWNQMYKRLEDIFGNKKIEDLPKKLKIIATNIENWEKKVFTNWYIKDAIRASISLPWIIAPHTINNEKFVDGGLISNLAVEEAENPDIIAVSIIKNIKKEDINYKPSWLFGKGRSSKLKILQKSIQIMIKENENHSLKQTDKNIIFLSPSFDNIEYYDFWKYKEIINKGYNYAREKNIL